MAKVIGISGPQGGGKTTLLNGLRDKGLHIDDFKVSRAVQAELGWDTLENVLLAPDTMVTFQEKVLTVKFAQEKRNEARQDVPFILTERTFADISSYAMLWAWELAHLGKWSIRDAMNFSVSYTEQCVSCQGIYHGNILLPAMPHILWQADPHRAKREHQGYITEQLSSFFSMKNPLNVSVFTVTEGSIDGRVQQVYDWIQTL